MPASNHRLFELPGIEELSKEQEAINYLPSEGLHLVIGGPGTGKSILALMRARLFAEQRRDYLFLVYNVLLDHASRQLYPGVRNARWIRWFNAEYRQLFQSNPPKDSNDWEDIAWESVQGRILDQAAGRAAPLRSKFLIIDEGQDMPPEFYETLLLLGAEHIFVTADPNQSVGKYNSRWDQLQAALGVGTDDVQYLTENFRQRQQGYHVARLAQAFYTDPGAKPLALPAPSRASTETPWVYRYDRPGRPFDRIVEHIIARIQRNPGELIGILTANNAVRLRYIKALGFRQNGVANPAGAAVSTYVSGMQQQQVESIHFDRGGILVINAQSCKGLEFDTVFIADIDQFRHTTDSDQTKRLFYVMISRARERLFLLRDGTQAACPVEDLGLLPTDDTLLRRNKA